MKLFRLNTKLNQPEDSLKLRMIVFTAQSLAILALAIITQLYGLWFVGTAILFVGHRWAYKTRHKQDKRVKYAVLVGVHVAFFLMIAAIMQGIPYPQAQFRRTCNGTRQF